MDGVGLQNTLNGLEKFFKKESITSYWIGYDKDVPLFNLKNLKATKKNKPLKIIPLSKQSNPDEIFNKFSLKRLPKEFTINFFNNIIIKIFLIYEALWHLQYPRAVQQQLHLKKLA